MHVLVVGDELSLLVEAPAALLAVEFVVLQMNVAHVALQTPGIGEGLVAQFAVVDVLFDVDRALVALQSALVQGFKGAHVTEELPLLMVPEVPPELVLGWIGFVAQSAG